MLSSFPLSCLGVEDTVILLLSVIPYLRFARFRRSPVGKTQALIKSGKRIMNAFEFNFIIIPLGTIVAVLVASVYYYAHREDMATRRTKKLICAYIKERARRLKIVNKEMARIDKLFKDASIDRQTCEHMKNMLVVIYEKESNEIATNIKINR